MKDNTLAIAEYYIKRGNALLLAAHLYNLEQMYGELDAKNADMLEALKDIASGVCCKTEGCCVGNPRCDVMIARSAIKWTEGDLANTPGMKDAKSALMLAALESALKTAEFENQPFRPWHLLAREAIKLCKDGEEE